MIEAKSKVRDAERATASVSDLVKQAVHVLREGNDGRIMVNFYGVFTDPHKRVDELQSARAAIDKALAMMAETQWPRDADYDLI